uniref:MIF4G_like_2 domain-containing protein n=1 Tax=Ascaris lumbricoides TaxID=6252 RepID=A0A0M3IWP2_ASCLU
MSRAMVKVVMLYAVKVSIGTDGVLLVHLFRICLPEVVVSRIAFRDVLLAQEDKSKKDVIRRQMQRYLAYSGQRFYLSHLLQSKFKLYSFQHLEYRLINLLALFE